jgi:hypothetical protein
LEKLSALFEKLSDSFLRKTPIDAIGEILINPIHADVFMVKSSK